MDTTSSTRAALHRFLYSGFTATDVAESFVSFDETLPVGEARAIADRHGYGTIGVRRDGHVVGFAATEDLVEGTCGDHLRYFGTIDVVDRAATLQEVIQRLASVPRVYVITLGCVGGIVSPSDLEKAPVRMWLFGILTLLEQLFLRVLDVEYAGESWRDHIAAGRLAKALELQQERQRRNLPTPLAQCLAFGDKADLVFKLPHIMKRSRFSSRKEARERVKQLEKLRNALAHTNPLVPEHLDPIHALARDLDHVLLAFDRPGMVGTEEGMRP